MKNTLILLLLSIFTLSASAQTKLRMLQDKSTGKYGFVDGTGNWAIPPQFDGVSGTKHFDNDGKVEFAAVKYKKGWGCINRKGEFVVKPVFAFGNDAWLAGYEWEMETTVGLKLYGVQDFETGKYGFVNHLGNWAIPPQFEGIHGTKHFDNDGRVNFAAVMYKKSWGCVNRKGEFVVKPVFPFGNDAWLAGYEWEQSSAYVDIPPSEIPNYGGKSNVPQASTSVALASSAKSAEPAPQTTTAPQANITPPTIAILNPKNGDGYSTDDITITYDAKSSDGKEPEIILSINGEPYNMNTKGVKRAFNEISIKLPRKEGNTNIMLIAKDSKGLNSAPAHLTLKYTGEKLKPSLHLLAVGISKYNDPNITDLAHASKDATDIADVIKKMPADAYQAITTPKLLANEDATAVNIKTAIMELVSTVNQDDVVFLYFSGHGAKELNEDYFISSDAKLDNLYSTAVNFNDIRRAMRMLVDKHCKVVAFMDACYAGALYDTKALSETLQLAQPGIIAFYSSTSSQKSNEADKWQNGIFTKALIEGLNGNAKDKNGKITTLELSKYIKEVVDTETKGTQTPIVENGIGEYILF